MRAQQAMAVLRMPAIEALHDMLEQYTENACATCGYPMGTVDEKRVVLQTIRTILDRTDMGPRHTLTIAKQSDGDLNLSLLTPGERAQLLQHLDAVKVIKDAVRQRQSQASPVIH